jgi:O-antigen ligase
VKFGRGGRSLHRFNVRRYKGIDMATPRQFSDGVTVVLPANSRIRLVPVEAFVGEYSYAVLNHASVAERLQMWSVAWDMFRHAPLLGVGTGAYMTEARERVEANTAPPVVAVYDHPHNEYLDALSSRGLIGLLALLLFLGVPAWLFSRGLGSPDPVRLGACLAGLVLPVGFALFGLTETMFIHSVTLGWYAIMTAVFLVTADATEGRVQ